MVNEEVVLSIPLWSRRTMRLKRLPDFRLPIVRQRATKFRASPFNGSVDRLGIHYAAPFIAQIRYCAIGFKKPIDLVSVLIPISSPCQAYR